MSTRRLIAFSLIVFVSTAGCKPSTQGVSNDREGPQQLTCSQCFGSPRFLQSGVSVSCIEEPNMVQCTLSYHGNSRQIALVRNGDVWGTAACPGLALVHDRHASNEDRLLLIDLAGTPSREKEVRHEEWGNYVHSHFSVIGVQGNRIAVEENQYAGDMPARLRTLQVNLESLSISEIGHWREDPRY